MGGVAGQGAAHSIWWGEAKDTAEQPTDRQNDPTTPNNPAARVSSAAVEYPCPREPSPPRELPLEGSFLHMV